MFADKAAITLGWKSLPWTRINLLQKIVHYGQKRPLGPLGQKCLSVTNAVAYHALA